MSAVPRSFRLRCQHCGAVLLAVGPRLTDDALRLPAEHIRRWHPSVSLPTDADAGAILAHFDVARTDAP